MRRIVLASILLVVAGLLLMLPSTALYNLITTGSPSGSVASRFAAAAGTTNNTTTIESLLGFGLVAVGALLEIFSIFTDVGGQIAAATGSQSPGAPTASTQAAKPEERQP